MTGRLGEDVTVIDLALRLSDAEEICRIQAAQIDAQAKLIDAARHLHAIYGEFGTGEAFWQAFRSLEAALDAEEVAS